MGSHSLDSVPSCRGLQTVSDMQRQGREGPPTSPLMLCLTEPIPLCRYKLYIIGEVTVKVNHCLLALPGVAKADLRRVISHYQALAQVDGYTRGLPGVVREAVDDTAGAARMVAKNGWRWALVLVRADKSSDSLPSTGCCGVMCIHDCWDFALCVTLKMSQIVDTQDRAACWDLCRDTAAVASARAGQLYGLEPLDVNIQDNKNNITRFLILSRDPRVQVNSPQCALSSM